MTVRTQFTDFSDFTVTTPIPESDGKEGLTIHYAEINPVVGNETIPMMWFVFEQNGMGLAEKNMAMSWASIEDAENVGNSQTVTCSVKYKSTQSYGATREV